MPVPMIAPMPRAISCSGPSTRRSVWPVCDDVISVPTDFVVNRFIAVRLVTARGPGLSRDLRGQARRPEGPGRLAKADVEVVAQPVRVVRGDDGAAVAQA